MDLIENEQCYPWGMKKAIEKMCVSKYGYILMILHSSSLVPKLKIKQKPIKTLTCFGRSLQHYKIINYGEIVEINFLMNIIFIRLA